MQDKPTPSAAVMILQLLGYVLAFVIPTAVAALLLPAYAPWIVSGAAVLFLIASGFIVGWQWENQDWTPEARGHFRLILFVLAWTPVAAAIFDTIRRPDDLALHATALAAMALVFTIGLVPTFYLGRAMHRRRKSPG